MPSSRKRIGFLPKIEIQNLIEKISKIEKLSQSKVTGMLVEEALISRGLILKSTERSIYREEILKNNIAMIEFIENIKNNKSSIKKIDNFTKDQAFISEISILEEDLEIMKEYLEYKNFKFIIKKSGMSILKSVS